MGSNPAGNNEDRLFYVFFFARLRSLERVDHSSRGGLLNVVEKLQREGLAPLGLSSHKKIQHFRYFKM